VRKDPFLWKNSTYGTLLDLLQRELEVALFVALGCVRFGLPKKQSRMSPASSLMSVRRPYESGSCLVAQLSCLSPWEIFSHPRCLSPYASSLAAAGGGRGMQMQVQQQDDYMGGAGGYGGGIASSEAPPVAESHCLH
jgi:hypothetical protein